MKKTTYTLWKSCLLCAIGLFLSSCSAMLPVSSSNGKIDGSKKGTAIATNVLGFWVTNDASIKAAANNGGITKVSTVDVEVTNYLWVVHIYKTVVVGE